MRSGLKPALRGANTSELETALAPASGPHRLLDLALGFRLLRRFPFVEELLAAGDGDLHLGPSLLEVHPERNQCEAALGSLAGELLDLAAMQKQLPGPLGLVVELVPPRVLGDVAVDEPDLAPLDLGIGVFETGARFAEALHLGAGQHQAALDGVEDEVLVMRAAIAADHLDVGVVVFAFLCLGHEGIVGAGADSNNSLRS